MKISLKEQLLAIFCLPLASQNGVIAHQARTVRTTSGILRGAVQNGVMSFKGIPFAQPPVGPLRFEGPIPFTSAASRNATTLGPACFQQFTGNSTLTQMLFNNPPPPESEDCLYLNVWAPADASGPKRAVMVWLFGGGFAFGSGSLVAYDGTSFAKHQDIIVVTTNYRTNVFGFPGAEELSPAQENPGLLDQELTVQWVKQNIAAFGGDPDKITIMGESAGSASVAAFIQRHPTNPPFRAGIQESGTAQILSSPAIPGLQFASFDALAKAVNCTQPAGAARMTCIKAVPGKTIHDLINGPLNATSFGPMVDNITVFSDSIDRILQHKTASVPLLIGTNQDEGTLFTLGVTDLNQFLQLEFGGLVTAEQVRAVYPGLNDQQVIAAASRDIAFACPTQLTVAAVVQAGQPNVFRYLYGPVFADLQGFPNAGAFHSSEIPEVFGTFNATTATPDEVTLSHTMQTMWANFIKHPTRSPAPNWTKFVPGNTAKSLAKLAFHGNVKLANVVEAVNADEADTACNMLWDQILQM